MNVITRIRQGATASSIVIVATDIVRSIAEHPDDVSVDLLEPDTPNMVVSITLHPKDWALVNAHEGRVLRALSTFVYAMAAKNNARIQVQVTTTRPPPSATLPSTLENRAPEGKIQRSEHSNESTPRLY